ncbi:MAG: translation initiation factor IF-2 [Firmicutes bacterium]|nr:translation initiation factor IF-2 [Bacillota bacterium]
MEKVRVYELAKELDVNSADMVKMLQKLGLDVKNHMSAIDGAIANQIRERTRILRERKESRAAAEASEETTPKDVTPQATAPAKSTAPETEEPEVAEVRVKPESPKKKKSVDLDEEIVKPKKPLKKVAPKGKRIELYDHDDDEIEYRLPKRRSRRSDTRKNKQQSQPTVATPVHKKVIIPLEATVKELAAVLGIQATVLIKKLMGLGIMASLNQVVDPEAAILVAEELGFEAEFEKSKDPEELYLQDPEDAPESLKPRPPVVTIMGHVDHGKTTLLDAIRESKVAATEAGGITQHIGAYQVKVRDQLITFLDTPGHEAFTAMRARGAQVTDIVVLVVAADDGVMPQTVEALNHAKAANVPIIVAINKMDKPTANPDRIKQELTEYNLIPEEWGGDTIYVPISALRKEGIDDILEMILLVAEMQEYKANPDRQARGVVIESRLDRGMGPLATVLIQKGTLRVGDVVVCGQTFGRIRAMTNYLGERIKEAGPSTPVQVLGLNDAPSAGDSFAVVDDEKIARTIAESRIEKSRQEQLHRSSALTLEDLYSRIKEGQVKNLNIVLKADVDGSVEALRTSLERLSNDEVKVQVIHSGVGGISESDVMLASASNAIIIGFNVRPEPTAKRTAEREKIDIRLYRIIYNAIDDVKAAIVGMLEPTYEEQVIGRAEVRQVIRVPKVGNICGSYVTDGKIARNAQVRVIRDNIVIQEDKIASLRRFKDDVREVDAGYECGIGLEKFQDIKEGDIIEAFVMKEVARSL